MSDIDSVGAKPIESHYFKAKKIANRYGITLYKSSRKNKKYMFQQPITKTTIHFGDTRYEDFLSHNDPNRRNRYRKRAEGILLENGTRAIDKKYSPAWAAYHILW